MNVKILHHDLEDCEKEFARLFKEAGVDASLIDVREARTQNFAGSDLVLNRVYASVANRDYRSIETTLNLLNDLESRGVNCLNSYRTSVFDYNKFESYRTMSATGIRTPETMLLLDDQSIDSFVDEAYERFSMPVILKRNVGGRGKDISKIDSVEELRKEILSKLIFAQVEKYQGGFIVQEFIKSARDYDCRIGVIDGNFGFSFKRSLVSKKKNDAPWLASCINGSVIGDYEAQKPEVDLAIAASECIGARFNELDITFDSNGPVIIENNPTPNYFVNDPSEIERMRLFVEKVKNSRS